MIGKRPAPIRERDAASRASSEHAFDVDHNDTSNRWDVVDEDPVLGERIALSV